MNPALLAHVDPEALCQRVPLADEENALGPWMEALKALTPCVEIEASCDTACYCSDPTIPSLKLAANTQNYRENVAANRRSLELIDAGIDRGRFQFPEMHGPESFSADFAPVFGLRDLVLLRDRYVRVLATDGQLEAAGRELLRSLQMADMVFRGDGRVVHFLVAVALKGIGIARCRAFAFSADATTETLTEILAALDRVTDLNGLMARSVRLEFQFWSLPIFDRLAAADTLDKFVDTLLERYYSLLPLAPVDNAAAPVATDDRNAWRRERIMFLLEGHPAPFDIDQTVRMASGAIAAAVRAFDARPLSSPPAPTPQREVSSRVLDQGAWPAHFDPVLLYEYIGNSRDARKHRKLLKDCMSPEMLASIQPPRRAALAVAKRKLREISNPVGRLLVERGACMPMVNPSTVARSPAEELATKVSLAIRLYFDRFGRAPSELGELVAAGLLPQQPIDPFDGLPLRYSRERGLLWSVGFDRIDGNGDPSGDYVWCMPVAGGVDG
ncbi:MAG TPA: hypothetical protein VND64_30675 [Pirellulales bacterium]|nr:hypothetical protein [Pirellulales bacterium]